MAFGAVNAHALVALATYKSWAHPTITGSGDDVKIGHFINVATELVENYCGQVFVQRAVSNEDHRGDGTRILELDKAPIASVTSILMDATTTPPATTAVTSTTYTILGRYGRAGCVYRLAGSWWEDGWIRANYTAGTDATAAAAFARIPDVVQVCADIVDDLRDEQKADSKRLASINIGGESFSYRVPELSARQKQLLEPHRLLRYR